MSATDLMASVKANKETRWVLSNSWFNHPQRLGGISVTGSLSYTVDEREFTPPLPLTAKSYRFELDFSLMGPYTRLFEDKFPWRIGTVSIGDPPAGPPSAGEFYMGHRPRRMWAAQSSFEPNGYATIGTCVETNWSRPSGVPPYTWTEGSSTTTDMEGRFIVFISLGGEPDSQGRGDGSDDEKIEIQFADQYTGTNSGLLPNLASTSPHILRLPWDDSWQAETAIFDTAFQDHLDAENLADGGGHSGNCFLTLHFASSLAPSANFSAAANSQLKIAI